MIRLVYDIADASQALRSATPEEAWAVRAINEQLPGFEALEEPRLVHDDRGYAIAGRFAYSAPRAVERLIG